MGTWEEPPGEARPQRLHKLRGELRDLGKKHRSAGRDFMKDLALGDARTGHVTLSGKTD